MSKACGLTGDDRGPRLGYIHVRNNVQRSVARRCADFKAKFRLTFRI